MAEYDLHSNIKLVHAIIPSAIAADTNGAAVDTLGFESLEWAIHVGTVMAGGGFAVTIEQSPDDGSGSATGVWTAVPAGETIGALPSIAIADANKAFRVGSAGKERHQRVVITETGTISGGTIGALAILGNPVTVPVPDQST